VRGSIVEGRRRTRNKGNKGKRWMDVGLMLFFDEDG
jgi:hypothetical protein